MNDLSSRQSNACAAFTLLPLERKYDRDMVRSCFASVIREREAKLRPHGK